MKKNVALALVEDQVQKDTRGGHNKYKPTKIDTQRVKNLILLGLSDEEIAPCVGVSGVAINTLRAHFGDLLSRYRKELLGKIAAGAYRAALPVADGGDKNIPPDIRSRMKIFVLKTKAGWKENDTTVINANQVQIVKRIIGVGEGDV